MCDRCVMGRIRIQELNKFGIDTDTDPDPIKNYTDLDQIQTKRIKYQENLKI